MVAQRLADLGQFLAQALVVGLQRSQAPGLVVVDVGTLRAQLARRASTVSASKPLGATSRKPVASRLIQSGNTVSTCWATKPVCSPGV
jgi:hypothetical protein